MFIFVNIVKIYEKFKINKIILYLKKQFVSIVTGFVIHDYIYSELKQKNNKLENRIS
jgi:hypothetical protein